MPFGRTQGKLALTVKHSGGYQGLRVGGGVAGDAAGLVAGAVGDSRSRVKNWAWSFWTAWRKAL